jgi:large subunit ribosomal protein L18
MAHGPTYRIKFRRRREGKTNYYRRRRLLLSKKPRLVVRKTNTATIVQLVNASGIGDNTVVTATSNELAVFGWQASTGNTPAAYLTGLLAGLRAKESGIKSAILDIGLHPPVAGSKIYAALKGALDAGIDVPYNPEVLPEEERITGVHVVEAYKHFKEQKNGSHMFSDLEQNKVKISAIPKQFEEVKKTLLEMPVSYLQKKQTAAPAKPKKAEKKPKRAKPARKAPRATPKKPRSKKLVARGKKSKKSKKK